MGEEASSAPALLPPGLHILTLDQIRRERRLQMRPEEDGGQIAEWAELMKAGVQFPALSVYQDPTDPAVLRLVDGNHRYQAAQRAGLTEFRAEVHHGDQRAALLAAIGANPNHGIRRDNATKRRAVVALLSDPEWARLSNRELAELAHVTHPFVGNVRRELESVSAESLNPVEIPYASEAELQDRSDQQLARLVLGWDYTAVNRYSVGWAADRVLTARLRARQRAALATLPHHYEPIGMDRSIGLLQPWTGDRAVDVVPMQIHARPHVQVWIEERHGLSYYAIYPLTKWRDMTARPTRARLLEAIARGETVEDEQARRLVMQKSPKTGWVLLPAIQMVIWGKKHMHSHDGEPIELTPQEEAIGVQQVNYEDLIYALGQDRQILSQHYQDDPSWAGYDAAQKGHDRGACPHPRGSTAWLHWCAGMWLAMWRVIHPEHDQGREVGSAGSPAPNPYRTKDGGLDSIAAWEWERGQQEGLAARRCRRQGMAVDRVRATCVHAEIVEDVYESGAEPARVCFACGLPEELIPGQRGDLVLR